MPATTSPEFRFREFRERAGLSHDEAAQQMGISSSCIWDIEGCEDELSDCYSPAQVRQFCRVLGISPSQLFGVETAGSPVSAAELVGLIYEQCRSRGVTLCTLTRSTSSKASRSCTLRYDSLRHRTIRRFLGFRLRISFTHPTIAMVLGYRIRHRRRGAGER